MKQTCINVVLLITTILLTANAFAIEPTSLYQPKNSARLTSLLQKVGTGQEALVAVKLRDKSVVGGYLLEVGEDSFTVTSSLNGTPTVVQYAQVDRLEGANVNTGARIHHGTGMRAKFTRSLSMLMPGHNVPVNGYSKSTTLIIGVVLGVLLAIILAKTL